jgi:hypothetical protein
MQIERSTIPKKGERVEHNQKFWIVTDVKENTRDNYTAHVREETVFDAVLDMWPFWLGALWLIGVIICL